MQYVIFYKDPDSVLDPQNYLHPINFLICIQKRPAYGGGSLGLYQLPSTPLNTPLVHPVHYKLLLLHKKTG